MKVVGAVSIILAILFVCAAVAMFGQYAHMENQVQRQSDFTKAASELTGVANQNRAQIEGSAMMGGVFMLGFLMLGGFGAALIGLSVWKKRGATPKSPQRLP